MFEPRTILVWTPGHSSYWYMAEIAPDQPDILGLQNLCYNPSRELSLISMSVGRCVFICVLAHMCTYMHTSVCMHVETKSQIAFHLINWVRVSHWTQSSHSLSHPPVFTSWTLGWQGHIAMPSNYAGYLHPSPGACVVSTLLTEPSHSPDLIILKPKVQVSSVPGSLNSTVTFCPTFSLCILTRALCTLPFHILLSPS